MRFCGTVVITGASSGIGWITAKALAGQGYYVYAGCRNEASKKELEKLLGERGEPIFLEVSSRTAIEEAFNRVKSQMQGHSPLVLINNAGDAVAGPVETLDRGDVERLFAINFLGPMEMIQRFLPLMRERGGKIVQVSSIAGIIALPNMGAYAASKHALEAMSDSLRLELKKFNIPVILIEPGAIKTPIWQKTAEIFETKIAALPAELKELYKLNFEKMRLTHKTGGSKGIDPFAVAEVISKALKEKSPKARYQVGADAKLGALLKRVLPASFWDRLAALL